MTEEITPADTGQTNSDTANEASPRSDDELRRLAAATLAGHLDIGSALIERCEQVEQVERRRRSREPIARNTQIRAHIKRSKVLAKNVHSNFASAEMVEK